MKSFTFLTRSIYLINNLTRLSETRLNTEKFCVKRTEVSLKYVQLVKGLLEAKTEKHGHHFKTERAPSKILQIT